MVGVGGGWDVMEIVGVSGFEVLGIVVGSFLLTLSPGMVRL